MAIEHYDTVRVLAIRDGQKYGQEYGPSQVDIDNDVEELKGTYREVTTVLIVGPWKVKPEAIEKTRRWRK